MTRGGRDKKRDDGPERRCIVTGESQPKAGLVRFVVGPEGQVVPDVLGRLPGRGFYVVSDGAAIAKAANKGLFSRAARQAVKTPDGLAEQVETQLARRVIDLISLARKAGQAVTGYEKVKDWLVKGQAIALIQASDGSERGKSKLRPPERKNGFIGCLTAQEMGLAFGREHAIHGALAAGGLGQRVVEEAARLAGFREQEGGTPADEDRQDA
ncbi:RNA-binding protein [Pseudorhodobacter sp.]|uniref:RNA-binding protein n=1 Tax=Pseudorhodobacter sp. TaxID=1934400 RepID=UPI0026486188|nr:RNA-binding protein [Pseudorhodobacter sp.]MDN5786447.1 RNA-binding protein [Pseudorhodobacter sp.]